MAEILLTRIEVLEKLIYGNEYNENKNNQEYQLNIKQRIEDLSIKIESMINGIPSLKLSHDIILKIGPVLFRQQFSIAQTEAKVLNLLTYKNQLFETVHRLQDIARLEPAVNRPFLDDMPLYIQQIQNLETEIQELQLKLNKQTKELDEFLDLYHNSMEFICEELVKLENNTIVNNNN